LGRPGGRRHLHLLATKPSPRAVQRGGFRHVKEVRTMRYVVAGAVTVAVLSVLSVLYPSVLVFAIGALVMFFIMALYIVLSGLGAEGAQRANFAEAWRRVHGTALRIGLIRA